MSKDETRRRILAVTALAVTTAFFAGCSPKDIPDEDLYGPEYSTTSSVPVSPIGDVESSIEISSGNDSEPITSSGEDSTAAPETSSNEDSESITSKPETSEQVPSSSGEETTSTGEPPVPSSGSNTSSKEDSTPVSSSSTVTGNSKPTYTPPAGTEYVRDGDWVWLGDEGKWIGDAHHEIASPEEMAALQEFYDRNHAGEYVLGEEEDMTPEDAAEILKILNS